MPRHGRRRAAPPRTARAWGVLRAGIVLGIGLGGLFDGIVFHQILQWHHMLSGPTPPDTVPNLQLNTLADGLFHGATWVVTLAGVWLLLRATGGRRTGPGARALVGGLLAGWGLFNLVEGVVDHYVLGVHHVRPGPDQALYDAAFLAWGALFLAVGWWLNRSTRPMLARRATLARR
jgi:uncharacterized membrane protein